MCISRPLGRWLSAALLLLLPLVFCVSVWAESSVTLAWDRSPDAGVVGYNLYYGGNSRSYTNRISIGNTNLATISQLTPGGTYYFTATALNSAGLESDYSNETSYTVTNATAPPTITSQPISQTVTAGETVTFTVVATSTAPLSYQWKKGTIDIPGATSATLTLTAVTSANAGSYTVVISNSAGSATSSAATLTVSSEVFAPVISTQPGSQTVTAGANVTFTVAATGTAPLGYQWKKGGTNIPGANSATLTFTVVTSANAGSYTVVVSNSKGSVTSSAATLTVNPLVNAPVITTQPRSQTVAAGDNVTFMVAASGTAPLGYQWKKDGTNIPGANSATLTLTAVTSANAGSYTVVVSNSKGSVTSSAATLTVNPLVNAPVITTQPRSQTVAAGDNVTFMVAASGTAPLGYQWKKDGTNIPGANSATLTLTAVTSANAGSYTVLIINSAGSVTSSAAVLTVNSLVTAPVITTQPGSQTVTAGDNVTFTVAASGTAPLGYQWKKDDTNIPGANSATLTLTAVTSANAGSYTVLIINSAGSVTSSAAVLTVNSLVTAPVITTQPGSQTVTAGDNVTLTVAATGTTPLSYQWKQDGKNIPGANSASLTLTAVTSVSAGSYSVVVINSAGSVTSSAAVLTVLQGLIAPTITAQPGSQTVTAGDTVTFIVAVTGTAPLSYQWKRGANAIPGANSASLTLIAVTSADAGGYWVTVSNAYGFVSSANAVLTVQPAITVMSEASSYTGLFSDPKGVSPLSSGSLAIKTTATGRFTGKLSRGGVRSSLSGQFDAAGHAHSIISSTYQPPMTVDLQVSWEDPDRITGTVSDGTFTATLLGDRAGFDGRQKLAPQTGRYTLAIDGNENNLTTTPRGRGFGTIIVNTAGGVRLAVSLADGSKITQAVPLSKNGDWPLFVSLYGGKGSIMSWSKFAQSASCDVEGEVVWIKPDFQLSRLYPAGFSFTTTVHGSRYQATPKVLSFTNGTMTLSGGDLPVQIQNQIAIDSRNRVTNLSSNKLSLTLSASTGLFSGKVMDPDSSTLIPFKGAVLQKENAAFGWFTGQYSQSGEVILSGQ